MTVVLIGGILTAFCIVGFVIGMKKDLDGLWSVSLVVGIFSALIGLLLVPSLATDHYEYVDITSDVQVSITESMIAVDLSGCDQSSYTMNSKIFNSYKAVTEFNDSTKIYFKIGKSFYGGTQSRKVLWSNYPYEKYNGE